MLHGAGTVPLAADQLDPAAPDAAITGAAAAAGGGVDADVFIADGELKLAPEAPAEAKQLEEVHRAMNIKVGDAERVYIYDCCQCRYSLH